MTNEKLLFFSVTLSGRLLPPQLIYAGKTTDAIQNRVFLMTGTSTTIPITGVMKILCSIMCEIIIPYVSSTRQALGLPPTREALAIFDVFAAHRVKSLQKVLTENNIKLYMYQQVVQVSCSLWIEQPGTLDYID